MIGTDLNLTLPSLSETMAVNIARCATNFSLIEDSIAQKVSPAGIDINAPLEMNGNSLTEVASVQFASGNMQNTAGSLYYFNGDWFVVDPVGTIQLTDNGQLNAGSVGGIKGDYGGVNPASVSYVDSSGQYIFTEDTGIYADLVADDLILQGSTGSLTINVDAALTGSRALNFKSLPSSGKSLLVYDAATSTLEDANITAPTNSLKGPITIAGALTTTGGITAGGNVAVTGSVSSTEVFEKSIELAGGAQGSTLTVDGFTATNGTGATVNWRRDLGLRVGDRVKSIILHVTKAGAGTQTGVAYFARNAAGGTLVQSQYTTSSGAQVVTLTISSPAALVSAEGATVEIKLQPSDIALACRVTYDRP